MLVDAVRLDFRVIKETDQHKEQSYRKVRIGFCLF